MTSRSTSLAIVVVLIGLAISMAGYLETLGVSITAFGLAMIAIGTVIISVIPAPIPGDAVVSLLADSIKNLEMTLEQSGPYEKAYFVYFIDIGVRAFIPFQGSENAPLEHSIHPSLLTPRPAPPQIGVNHRGLSGLLIEPLGSTLVKAAGIEKEDDVEEALRLTLVEFSGLADSVRVQETGRDGLKVQIRSPRVILDSPLCNNSFGTPVSSIAACVVAVAKGQPVRIIDEVFAKSTTLLTLAVVREG